MSRQEVSSDTFKARKYLPTVFKIIVIFFFVVPSVWVVIDVINASDFLAYSFPDHDEQKKIARAFEAKSGADFNCVIGAIDGLLICIHKPAEYFCKMINCGAASFRCHRKDKFGLNMQAICDHKLRFRWIDVSWPGASSDYMAWATSTFCVMLETGERMLENIRIRVCENHNEPDCSSPFTLH